MSPRARFVLLALLLASAACSAAPLASARGARSVDCPTRGLHVSGAHGAGYRVVTLQASGYSCSAARGVARRLAESLLRTGTIQVSGGSLEYSSVDINGATKDTISLSESGSSIELTLEGSGPPPSSGLSPAVPLPAPTPSSGGSVIA